MKLILFSVFVSALTNAEPASYTNSKNNDPDFEIQQVEVIEIPWKEESEATPPVSYSPPQQEYNPPKQELGPPNQKYGPPKQEYGPPKPVYGPPPEGTTTTEADLTTTTEYPTTTIISTSNSTNSTNSTNTTKSRFGKLKKDDLIEKGVYYVYHPNGALQRVVYSTKDDVKNMAYSAELKYQNVEPINGPIYTYDPQTYLFRRVNK